MCKRFLALMLALVMFVTLLPSTALTAAASSVTEPLADETASDGSPSSDETQPPEDPIAEGDPASDSPSEALGLPDGQDEPVDTEDDSTPPQETDGPENDGPAPTDVPPMDSADADLSEPDTAPISIGDGVTNADKVKQYFGLYNNRQD